tara:strand:+ start:188 stop:817 length:630 start_codon:yes stop_codon:yes gene_type:complete
MNNKISILNKECKEKKPQEVLKKVFSGHLNPVLTTNFRPYEVAILHLCTQISPNIKVVWCDSGYNTEATYKYAKKIIVELGLNIKLYKPLKTSQYYDMPSDKIPEINDPQHEIFTEEVKLEPFRRAMSELKPDLWITNLRKGQTNFRDSLDIFTESKDGLLKVSPFYYWTDYDLDNYMKENGLENEYDYFDPTKVDDKRECGLHNKGSK